MPNKVTKGSQAMKKLEHDLLTSKYTEVYHESPEEMKYNAPHNFVVRKVLQKEEYKKTANIWAV
jgi:hypothetical protein